MNTIKKEIIVSPNGIHIIGYEAAELPAVKMAILDDTVPFIIKAANSVVEHEEREVSDPRMPQTADIEVKGFLEE